MITALILYAGFVLGARFRLMPGPVTIVNWPWQIPTNIFIFIDRAVNYWIVCPLLRKPKVWETVSGHIGRDYPGSKAEKIINALAWDMAHCHEYIGV